MLIKEKLHQAAGLLREFGVDCWITFTRESEINGDPTLVYLAPGPVFPDNYTPNVLEDSLFATDTNLGFSGGDITPMLPGSRFRIFDTH